MSAIYDEQVRNKLYEYEKSLKNYPISVNRRLIKIKNLRLFLQNLSKHPESFHICDKKKLGQIILPNGNFLNTKLRQTTYRDESNTQWSISFFQVSKNVVKIYRILQSEFVDESIEKVCSLIERINNLYKII